MTYLTGDNLRNEKRTNALKIRLGQWACTCRSKIALNGHWHGPLTLCITLNHWCTIDLEDIGERWGSLCLHAFISASDFLHVWKMISFNSQFRTQPKDFFLHTLSWSILKPYETDSNPFINHLLSPPNPPTTIWTVLYQNY